MAPRNYSCFNLNTCDSVVNSYLDIFTVDYSAKTILAELARCLSLFENLHTVQIDVDLDGGDPLKEFFKQTSKSFHILRFAMFSSCVPIYPSLYLAHRHGALSLPEIAHCPYHVCKVYFASALIRKYLKTSVMFFGHPILAGMRNLYMYCIKGLTISHSQVIANNFPNLRTIQFVIHFLIIHPPMYVPSFSMKTKFGSLVL